MYQTPHISMKKNKLLPVWILSIMLTNFNIGFAGNPTKTANINWLDQSAPSHFSGTTFGVPWERGLIEPGQTFKLMSDEQTSLDIQTWPFAFWPDGSVKWTAVAVSPGDHLPEDLKLIEDLNPKYKKTLKVIEDKKSITIKTGIMEVTINKSGSNIFESISREGVISAKNGHLVVLHQNTPELSPEFAVVTTHFTGQIKDVLLEQDGPIRSVVKLSGIHQSENNNQLMPFSVRLYFYAGSENIRIMHSITYDGDEEKDFIRGIGVRFDVPMHNAQMHDRHIRFSGENDGVFAEAVKGLTGLRRDPGSEIISAQLEGLMTPAVEEFPERVRRGLPYIATFGDYTLFQSSSNAFRIRKRTEPGHTWLNAGYGSRSSGAGFVGSPLGGIGFGIRNFWQSYPAQIDIRKANTDNAQVTLWLWAPESDPMDLRFYHDGMGMDTYEKQWEGLEIIYEDYEPGFGRPIGVARTSELDLWVPGKTPARENFASYAASVAKPPILMADLQHIYDAGVFGGLWTVKDSSDTDPIRNQITDKLDWLFDYYKKSVDMHNWYGFWDYGDFMHTYDYDRHVWRYDVGGYAWDNSELATDIWLWYYFLHSGRADAFRMAEAMTRHTGEVDVHHIGPFAPLGSRHNVLHWGCSAKQLRISTVANRRYYYYLTADDRVGDLMDAQIEAHRTLHDVPPLRKRVDVDLSDPSKVLLSFGTDWGSIASAWLTDWERNRNKASYKRIRNGMKSIAAQPQGFFTGVGMMDVETGAFEISDSDQIVVSHLNAVFGLIEIVAELIELIDIPEFEEAWLQYCKLYNASDEEQYAALGTVSRNRGLRPGHSRLTAYASMKKSDKELALRAWEEFILNDAERSLKIPEAVEIKSPYSLNTIIEAPDISTNYAAQWGLAAMQILRLIDVSKTSKK
ncbi:hypothetical protein EV194_103237 [Natronoflexus pectinivorans]|uniref:Tat pathway signal sequence domain protein n=2 Tax=Natronoflexus pectinivorans TaxID=682526 RepID=A0A4R2GNP9_9BACT|nr:hypothetical protein EV194_103237 [Natronoflexus pectinivorans]